MRKRAFLFFLFSLTVLLILGGAGCRQTQKQGGEQAGLANPASVYCEENEGKIEIREDEQGNQAGWCIFPDNSECEEWAFFRGECQPDSQPKTILDAINNGEILQCIIGRNDDGTNKVKLVAVEEGCPKYIGNEILSDFCGKDTARVESCMNGEIVKLTSTLAEAGPMFFQGDKILSCPKQDSGQEISQDCIDALVAECQTVINCDE